MDERRAELLQYLEGMSALRRRCGPGARRGDRSYEAVVLDRGQFWPGAPRPDGVPKMPPKLCFTNAFGLAQSRGWSYAEGWATSVIPVHHAWCLNDAGRVVDPTWEEPEQSAYMGLRLDLDYVRTILLRSETWGVFFKRESRDLLKCETEP